jgi:hypothetical protein
MHSYNGYIVYNLCILLPQIQHQNDDYSEPATESLGYNALFVEHGNELWVSL